MRAKALHYFTCTASVCLYAHRVPFKPYNPNAKTRIHRQNLPHWRQWGTTYFVTTRLADSIPAKIAADWRHKRDTWLRAHGLHNTEDLHQLTDEDRHEYHREFTAKFHNLLDAGHGECLLAQRDCADIVIAENPKKTGLQTGHIIGHGAEVGEGHHMR